MNFFKIELVFWSWLRNFLYIYNIYKLVVYLNLEILKCVFLKFYIEFEVCLNGFCSMVEIFGDIFIINDFF